MDGEYVHNSVFESFLGLGILGGCLFVAILGAALVKAVRLAEQNKQYLFCSLLLVQYIMYSLFSRTLSMLPLFWLALILILCFTQHHDESNDHSTVL